MTAIVAIRQDNTVYMGGDSAGVAGLKITIRKDPKVFINGNFLMGFTTSFRMGQLLQYSFKPPEHPKNMTIESVAWSHPGHRFNSLPDNLEISKK